MSNPLPDDEDLVGRLRLSVARLNRILRHQVDEGMPPTDSAILETISWEGEPTLGQLASTEHVGPPTVTKSISNLEAAGLIERVADPADGRIRRVRLSEQGNRMVASYRVRTNAWLVEEIAKLPVRDQRKLSDVVTILEHLIAAARRDGGSDH